MKKDLQLKTVSNISYNAVANVTAFVCRFMANLVLSRNLSSSDYGIVGFSFIFIEFLKQFEDIGITNAVIQKRDLTERGLYTSFSIKMAIGVVLFFLAIIVAPLAPRLFDNDAVVSVIRLLSLNFLINIFSFLPTSLLKRDLDYRTISRVSLLSSVVNSSMAVILVLLGYGYWSIAVAHLLSTVTTVVLINIRKPVRIALQYDSGLGKGFLDYGWKLFACSILTYTLFNFDNFVVGNLRGSSALGYYFLAFNWASLICTMMWSTVHEVFVPTYSRIQENRPEIKRSYLRTLEYVSLLSILANFSLFFVSKDFLIHVLGRGTDKWIQAVSVLKIFCVYGVIRSLLEPIGSVIMALGNTGILLKANTIAAILQMALLYPAVKMYGIEGAAVVVTLAYSSQYLIYIPYLKSELQIDLKELTGAVRSSVVSLMPIFLIDYGFSRISLKSSIFLVVIKIFLFCSCYIVTFGFLSKWSLLKDAIGYFSNSKKTQNSWHV